MRVEATYQNTGYQVTLDAGESLAFSSGPIVVFVPNDLQNRDMQVLRQLIDSKQVQVEPYVPPAESPMPLYDQLERCAQAFAALKLADNTSSKELRDATLEALSAGTRPVSLCDAVAAAVRGAYGE